MPTESPPLTDEETIAVDELEAKIEDLVGILEDEETSDEGREAAETRIGELNARIESIINKPPVVPDELKPQVGVFLLVDDQGRPRLDTTYYTEISADDGAAPDNEGGDNSAGATAKPGRAAGLSQRLVDELAMQRRDILAVFRRRLIGGTYRRRARSIGQGPDKVCLNWSIRRSCCPDPPSGVVVVFAK